MKTCFPVRKQNGQDYATLDEMMQLVNAEPHGTWLAGTNLLWHGGIHLSEASAKWSILEPGKADATVPVQCMVGGEIVVWRVNQDYLTNVYADHTLQYSSTFVLVKSTCQPDPENEKSWLDFYTLYMGLAPLSAFEKHKCMKVKAESGIRRHPHGRYEGSQSSPTMTTSYKGTWKKGTRVLVLKEQTFTYRHKENQVFGLAQEIDAHGALKGKTYWISTSTDFMEPDGEEYAHLPTWMKQAVEQGGFDNVVKPAKPLTIAAGDAIGFLGKDTDSTGAADAETSHFIHIEVLCADPRMPDFLNNTAQVKTGRKYIRLHEDGKLYTRTGDTFTENSGELGKDIHRVLPEDQCNPFTDAEKKRWFQVSPQSWMSQEGVDELPQYSLKELGFTALEQSATSDMAASLCEDWAKQALGEIAKHIVPARGLQEKQVADYYQKAMKRIDIDGNGKLSAQELHAAFTHPEMGVCDIVARMVVKHDSEWFGNSGDPKWTAYYKDYDKPLLNYSKKWQDDMSWMESVEPFNKGEPVWHMHPVMFLSALSDDDQLITYEQLKSMLPSGREGEVDIYLEPLNETMRLFEINTPLRKAHFMAQILHETGYFKDTEELGTGKIYEGRVDLGNTQAGDGPLFKGRGLLQITGRDNYTKCQMYLKQKLNDDTFDITSSISKAKQLANNPRYAALASGYFWRYIKPKLNKTADKDDVYWVSVYVNGWAVQAHPYYPDRVREPNHMDDRINKLSITKKVFGVE